jgi:hypothetical protein
VEAPNIEPPVAHSWAELFDILLDTKTLGSPQARAALFNNSSLSGATKLIR